MTMVPTAATSHSRIWLQWGTEPSTAIALVMMAAVYAAGVRAAWKHAGRGRGIRMSQVSWFAAGVLVLVVALASPIDVMSDDLFAAHMVQHVLLATVAPPLLLLGAPVPAVLWALRPTPRRRVARWAARTRLRGAWRALTAPAAAWLIHAVAIWAWHMPRLYQLALRSAPMHALEHVCFVGSAVFVWWAIVHPRQARRTGYAIGILTLFGTAMQTGALGALLTLSRSAWYPIHAAGAASWGLTALEDQQLAGLIMWVVGGLLYLLAISVLFVAWLEAKSPDRSRPDDPALGIGGRRHLSDETQYRILNARPVNELKRVARPGNFHG